MFCQVVAYYHLGHKGTLELPIRTFWLYSNNIQRIEADKARRQLRVHVHGTTGEDAQALMDLLSDEVGEVVKLNGTRLPSFKRDDPASIAAKLGDGMGA